MTEPIAVEFTGNIWYNPDQFQHNINQHPIGEPLILDFRNEGPSLRATGIMDVINSWLRDRHLPPTAVHLNKWANPVEFVPYRRLDNCTKLSHFFHMSKNYWQDQEPTLEQQLEYQKPFGLFIGRMMLSRAVIFYQAMKNDHNVLTSRMSHRAALPWYLPKNNDVHLDNLSDWLSLHEQIQMFEWYNNNPVSSLDNKSVGDQYITPDSWIDTNTSLLQHYHNFAVEIVCETCVHGDAFTPTEKTIRPIMAAKPVIIFGPQYYLARLRSLGFQTYHKIWDESYDLYQGPERWQLMQKSMNLLLECSRSDQHKILSQAHEIAMFNRQRLWDIWNFRVHLTNHDYSNI
jgi:hypothetical protein